MQPGRYNLDLYRGDTHAWRFELWADTALSEEVDLTGATVAAELRDKPAGAVVVELACVVTLPNIVDVTLAADQWDDIPSRGVWDLEVTFASGVVRTVLRGDALIKADVTNSTAVLV